MQSAKLILVFLIAVILSGCQLLPSLKKDEQVTLKYWGLWESASTVNKVISEYKKVKPNVEIVYEKRSKEQYRETLQNFIESGKGPDIFRFHNTWTPMIQGILSSAPSNVISQNDFKKDYYPTVLNDLRNSNKEIIGVPLEFDGLALYWNEEIFNAAGLTKPPATWPELAQIATKLTVKDQNGNIDTAGVGIGTSANVDHFSDILAMMILQNGGDLKIPTDKESIDAIDYYTSFAQGTNRVWDETLPNTTTAFTGGHLAMYFGPSWRAIEIKNGNRLLKFKIASLPQLEGSKVTWASYWAEGVSAKSPNQEEAWDFIKFLSQDENLIKLYTEAATSPDRFIGEPYPKLSLASKLSSDPIVGPYIADAPYARSFPMASRTFDNGINDGIIKIYKEALDEILRTSNSKTALENAAKKIDTVLKSYQTPTKK